MDYFKNISGSFSKRKRVGALEIKNYQNQIPVSKNKDKMALQIEENNGVFEIIGKITSQHLRMLKTYFKAIQEKNETLFVSIEKVTEMDTSAAYFFEKLYKEVAGNNQVIHIIGKHNSQITEVMRNSGTEYILSPDRV